MKLLTPESLRVSDRKSGVSKYLLVTPLEDGLSYRVSSNHTGVLFSFFKELAEEEEELGRMLIDVLGNWIYDGRGLSVAEQEDLAFQVLHHSAIKTTETKISISDFYERHL